VVSKGRGRLFRRKDGKYLVYLPVYLAEDSMFPFKDFGKGRRGASKLQNRRQQTNNRKMAKTRKPVKPNDFADYRSHNRKLTCLPSHFPIFPLDLSVIRLQNPNCLRIIDLSHHSTCLNEKERAW
jgi:hypothetical protein